MRPFNCSIPNREGKTSKRQDRDNIADNEGVDFRRGPDAFIERRQRATRTALICPEFKTRSDRSATIEARRPEFAALAHAIHLDVIADELIPVREIKPATFIGGGQVEQLADRIDQDEIELVLVDAALTPIQQRNLERGLGAKVLDRTALILEIFGERAATREGVLQVELAHLNYQRSRLVRSWTHLERQRGGFGFLGGPGETQIEADRRQLRDRIALLEKRIDKVRRTREQQRKPRNAVPFPLVALVGYTNAGKSTLFNQLTGAGVMAKDLLFATLDTSVRKLELPHGKQVIMSDTVGFIADLPTDLVAAFRATLEEVVTADLILHVRDVANSDHEAQANEVQNVLTELGVNAETTPVIEVWNKMDLVDPGAPLVTAHSGAKTGVPVSAQTGEGLPELREAIETALAENSRFFELLVPHEDGQGAGWLHDHTEVIAREDTDEGIKFKIRVEPRFRSGFLDRFSGNIVSSRDAAA